MLHVQHMPGQSALLLLLGLVALKHFLADFVLQTSAIARAKEARTDWLWALILHTSIHAALLLPIIALVAIKLWWLALVDLVIHTCIDRTKTLINRRLQVTPTDAPFWWLLGADQFLHQVTNILIVMLLVDLGT